MKRWTAEEIAEIEARHDSPRTLLEWALDRLHPRLALASAFGAEGMVVIDMLIKIDPRARIFTLDTGRLHQQTYDLMDSIRKRYGVDVEVLFPDAEAVRKMVGSRGLNLFYDDVESRQLCCDVRKIQPLKRMLATLDGWITGLRRDQNDHRSETARVEIDDHNGGILKINPLAEWSWSRTWRYIREHDVPYNALHDRGFPSIGCEPCTRAIRPGERQRAGRWWWERSNRECGIHVDRPKASSGESEIAAPPSARRPAPETGDGLGSSA